MRRFLRACTVIFVGAIVFDPNQVVARYLSQNSPPHVYPPSRPAYRHPVVQNRPVVGRPPIVHVRPIMPAVVQWRLPAARGGNPFNVNGVPHRNWNYYRPAHLVRGAIVPGVGAHYFVNTDDGVELVPSGVDNSGPPFDIESFIQSLLPDGSAPNDSPDALDPPAPGVDDNTDNAPIPGAPPHFPDARDAAIAPAKNQNQNAEMVLPLKMSLWVHNGSVVYLVANGAHRRFYSEQPKAYYDPPKTGVIAVGIRKSTLLFDGTQDGNQNSGKAYTISERCGIIAYAVSGSVSEDQRKLTMNGNAPRLDSQCQRVGDRDDPPLILTYEKTAD
jgi:hypothetical protein